MKYLNIAKQMAAIAVVALLFSACKTDPVQQSIGDQGQTLVKLMQGGTPPGVVQNPVDFVPTPTTIQGCDVRRDIPNPTELNKKMTIIVRDDTNAINFFNQDTVSTNPNASNPNKLFYYQLPQAWYTVGAGTPKSGGNYSVVMNPGEFAKQIMITITNATLMNPSSTYALAFTITSADANGKISTMKSLIVSIGAKNNWDGVYNNVGNSYVDILFPAFTYGGPQQYSLITVGATKCVVRNDDLNGGIPGYIFLNAGAGTYYGSYGLEISFNPATNTISDLYNYYGDPVNAATVGGNPALGSGAPLYSAANTRRAILDPSGTNAVQGNRDIIIKHILVQPSLVAPPSYRSYFDEVWKYVKSR